MTTFIKGHYHMWFLPMIVGLYVLIPLIRKLVADEKLMRYFLIFAFITNFLMTTINDLAKAFLPIIKDNRITGVYNAIYGVWGSVEFRFAIGYIGYFVLGYYLSRTALSKRTTNVIYLLSVVGFVSTIMISALIARLTNKPYGFYGNFEINVLLESIGDFLFVKNHQPHVSSKATKMIELVSKYSFGIYLVHDLLLKILLNQFGISSLSFNAAISVPMIALGVFVVGFLISACIHKIPILKKYVV